jgi:hypothetical protein
VLGPHDREYSKLDEAGLSPQKLFYPLVLFRGKVMCGDDFWRDHRWSKEYKYGESRRGP